jgi:hypothetical protein
MIHYPLDGEIMKSAFAALTLSVVVCFSFSIAIGADPTSADAPAPRPKVVEQKEDGTLALLAIDAKVDGKQARIEKKGTNPHNIGYWTNKDDKVIWQAQVTRGGKFEVEVEFSLDKKAEGSEYVLEFGKKQVEVKPPVTGTWMDFRKEKVGVVELEPGLLTVVVRPTKKPGQAVLDLRGITLKPVK